MSQTSSQNICILGATGSIGGSTLAVMRANNLSLVSVSAFNNVDKMYQICQQFVPKVVVMVDFDAAEKLSNLLKNNGLSDIKVLSGADSLITLATDKNADIIVAGIVGSAGLPSTLAGIQADKTILLANKESLVMAGGLMMQALKNSAAKIYTVDSEHNAIFQCLPDGFTIGQTPKGVRRILLTGSGGPFLTTPNNKLSEKTVTEAVNHPNWSMGAKISVDSATMMNKGLEWIEAKFMFNLPDDSIEIVIHPQSIIHSMVEYQDGSVLSQMGCSDMKIPIAHCFGECQMPKIRMKSTADYLDFTRLNALEFYPPDLIKFPALRLIKEAWQQGGTAITILNAANEIAVASFLQQTIKFTDIAIVVEQSLSNCTSRTIDNLDTVNLADQAARLFATDYIKTFH